MQRQRVLHARRAVFLFRLEYLFYEKAAYRRAREIWRLLSRTCGGSSTRASGRVRLGDRHSLQPCGGELHGRGDLLRDWPVRADGRGPVGRLRLEGIPGRQPPGQDISCLDVSLLSFCHSPRVSRQYRKLTGALEINSMDAMPKILRCLLDGLRACGYCECHYWCQFGIHRRFLVGRGTRRESLTGGSNEIRLYDVWQRCGQQGEVCFNEHGNPQAARFPAWERGGIAAFVRQYNGGANIPRNDTRHRD